MPRALLAPLAGAALLLLAGCGGSSRSSEPVSATTTPGRFLGTELSPARAAPPIALHDASGQPVTLQGQRGRYVLVTFIYTHCPDVCPLITQNLNAALRQHGPERTRVRVLALRDDPKGDTAAAVRAYDKRMHLVPQFRYLIGSRAELRRVWKAWHVLAVSTKPDLVDHVAYTALVDTTGKERVLYDSSVKARQVLHDLRALLA
jgi:protein SCO1/2